MRAQARPPHLSEQAGGMTDYEGVDVEDSTKDANPRGVVTSVRHMFTTVNTEDGRIVVTAPLAQEVDAAGDAYSAVVNPSNETRAVIAALRALKATGGWVEDFWLPEDGEGALGDDIVLDGRWNVRDVVAAALRAVSD